MASLVADAGVDRCVDNLLTISPRVLFFAAAGCAKEAGREVRGGPAPTVLPYVSFEI